MIRAASPTILRDRKPEVNFPAAEKKESGRLP